MHTYSMDVHYMCKTRIAVHEVVAAVHVWLSHCLRIAIATLLHQLFYSYLSLSLSLSSLIHRGIQVFLRDIHPILGHS